MRVLCVHASRLKQVISILIRVLIMINDAQTIHSCSSLGGLYSGGSAQMVENSLNIHGDEILYVGDHIYTDVSQSKLHLRWRTALICRELEDEVSAYNFPFTSIS